MFTGVQGAPTARCGAQGRPQYVAVDTSPVIAEKPYLIMDRAGKFSAVVPPTNHAANPRGELCRRCDEAAEAAGRGWL